MSGIAMLPTRLARSLACATVLVSATAVAEPDMALSTRWPNIPDRHGLSLQDQITDRLTEIGNQLGQHLDTLSADMFQLKVDGRRQRAHIRLGAGDVDTLSFNVDCGIQFQDLNAHVDAHIDLGFDGHLLRLELPEFQVQAAEYRGDYGVQVEVPVFVQRF
jgi:hypothetical protein